MNNLLSLSELFHDRIFRIPDYQRGYGWDKRQLNDFWEDITSLEEQKRHYTGMISLEPTNSKAADGSRIYQVIDGQQRLTTCIILLTELLYCAEKSHIASLADVSLESAKSLYIRRKPSPHYIEYVYCFDYLENENLSVYFRHKILDMPAGGALTESLYTRKLYDAKCFFRSKITDLCQGNPDENARVLSGLFTKLTRRLQFNLFEIDNDYEVFEAFETMNNRGKALSMLEILKNRLIYLTTLYSSEQLPDADSLRRLIHSAWKEVYTQLGRCPDGILSDDEYLRDHWIMYFEYVRRPGDDFKQFLQEIFSKQAVYHHARVYGADANAYDPEGPEDAAQPEKAELDWHDDKLTPEEIEDYVKSLKESAQYWFLTYHPEQASGLSNEEKEWLDRLRRLGYSYFRPLVTVSLLPGLGISGAERTELYRAIERFIFSFFRMANYRFDFQISVYRKAAYELRKGKKSIRKIITDLRNAADQNAGSNMDFFIVNMDRRFETGDGFYAWQDIRYLMYEYEKHLTAGKYVNKLGLLTLETETRGKVSIEHILPQTPTEPYWREQFEKYIDDGKKMKMFAGSIGNLVPLHAGANSSLQNKNFIEKKKIYSEGTYSEIEVSKYEDWGPCQILDRGMKMLAFIEKRWELPMTEKQKYKLLHAELLDLQDKDQQG